MSAILGYWLFSWWLASLAAEILLFVRALAWRRVYPKFTAYLAFDLAASVTLFCIAHYHPPLYDIVWRSAQVLLIVGRVALVNESYLTLKRAAQLERHMRAWRPPVTLILTSSVIGGGVLHWVLARPFLWPSSTLEPIFSLIGLSNVIMGCTLLGILVTTGQSLRVFTEYRHAVILSVYLLLTSAAYYSATRLIDRMGAYLMIVAAISYLAWAVVMSERRTGPVVYLEYPHGVTHKWLKR